MHLNTITELLGIPNYKVAEMIKNTPDRIGLMLEQIEVTDPICSGCGRIHNTSVHSTGTIVVEDLRISAKRIFLHVPKRKSICIEDGKIRVEENRPHHIRLDATTPYYLHEGRQARRVLAFPLILVGGMRTLKDMEAVLDEGVADAISMCRPFIMDPHIVRKFREGLTDESKCTSCNGCLHEMRQGNMRCILV